MSKINAIKVLSYDSEGKRVATKTFDKIPDDSMSNPATYKGLAGSYSALTSATVSKGQTVVTEDFDVE